MQDRPIVNIIRSQGRIFRLFIRYIYLHIQYFFLVLQYCLLIVLRTVLREAVKIEYFVRLLSRENRVILAACIVFSLYLLVFNVNIRI